MKIYIIAGEPSGDLHGGNLITALKKYTPTPDIRGWGGHQHVPFHDHQIGRAHV